jgi:hypothetical protein
MKNRGIITALIVICLLMAGGCSNVCQEPHSINFNQQGPCIDMTGSVTGTYSGTLRDSTGGSGTSYPVQIKISKVDNSDVSVQLLSPLTAPFTGFNASVAISRYGYYLAVTADSPSIVGAAATYISPADGVYVSSDNTLDLFAEANPYTTPTFEEFIGRKQ